MKKIVVMDNEYNAQYECFRDECKRTVDDLIAHPRHAETNDDAPPQHHEEHNNHTKITGGFKIRPVDFMDFILCLSGLLGALTLALGILYAIIYGEALYNGLMIIGGLILLVFCFVFFVAMYDTDNVDAKTNMAKLRFKSPWWYEHLTMPSMRRLVYKVLFNE